MKSLLRNPIGQVCFALGVSGLVAYLVLVAPPLDGAEGRTGNSAPQNSSYFERLFAGAESRDALLHEMSTNWQPWYGAVLIETIRFGSSKEGALKVAGILANQYGANHGTDWNAWYQEIWKLPHSPHADYAEFKADLYSRIDPTFREYFDGDPKSTIRMDEVRWGGVVRDGIPPLKDPDTLAARKADYLADTDIVFGVALNGEARAYPKRILAWHEMVKDTVGNQSINGVYCTLCGSMIVYNTETGGKHYELGTSGFLYRSNKLMYDHATKSMWSTLRGEPVIGELVGKGIKLEPLYVVTTTWGNWKKMHPGTTVLSLKTGHRRNYGEGVAYHDYFATDELMFKIADGLHDDRLKNKQEVFALRTTGDERLAISTGFLGKNPIYHDGLNGQSIVVLTDRGGASRAYETGKNKIKKWVGDSEVADSSGKTWKVTEDKLVGKGGGSLRRLPSHRVFWFAWHATHPETRLVK